MIDIKSSLCLYSDMLKIKNKHHLDFPFIIQGLAPKRELVFEPVPSDDDELTQAIASDDDTHDNKWVLNEYDNAEELNAFWTRVEQEIADDPEWVFEKDS